MQNKYNHFTVYQFLDDAEFISRIKNGPSETTTLLNAWLNFPDVNLSNYLLAQKELNHFLSVQRKPYNENVEDAIWQKIDSGIQIIKPSKAAKIIKLGMLNWITVSAVAACLLVVLFIGKLLQSNEPQIIETSFNQLKKVNLSDKSEVQLNANSSLKIISSGENEARSVYLNGEAFFKVTHLNIKEQQIANKERFIVFTDKIQVEVLGTSFNVKERRGKTEVSLEEGSISLFARSDTLHKILLHPGELVNYIHATGKFVKQMDDPITHKAWTEKKIITTNTTVADILTDLEDMYGYEITLQDSVLANRRIDGIIPLTNEKNVLFILSNMLDVDIIKQNNKLIITPRKK